MENTGQANTCFHKHWLSNRFRGENLWILHRSVSTPACV